MSCPRCGIKGEFKFCPGCGAACSPTKVGPSRPQKGANAARAMSAAASMAQSLGSAVQHMAPAPPPTWSVVVGELPPAAELLARIQRTAQVANQALTPPVPSQSPSTPPAIAEQCSRCATVLRAGARFCAKCGGAPSPLAAPPAVCQKCGLARDAKSRFCGRCGTKVD